MTNKSKLTSEQNNLFAGYYDTLAIYFGGDAIHNLWENYFKGDQLAFLNKMPYMVRKLEFYNKQGMWAEISFKSKDNFVKALYLK
jgi:hypothetical protein